MGLKEGRLGPEEMMAKDVLGGKDSLNKGVRKVGTWTEPEPGERQQLRSDRKPSLPFSFLPSTFLQLIIMPWGLGFDTQTAVATAPERSHAYSDCAGCSGVFVQGLIKPRAFGLGESGAEEQRGGEPLSFQASAFRSQDKQTREATLTTGSKNRLNIETRRQARHPVFFKQMGEQEVGSEGNGKSWGKKVGRPRMF